MRAFPVLNLGAVFGASFQMIDSYQVGNLLDQISTYAPNGPAITAMVGLSRSDPATYAATMGPQADAFMSTARDSDSHVLDIQTFQKEFTPVGSKNQIDPTLLASVKAWLTDQQALAGYLQDHPVVSPSAPTTDAAGNPLPTPLPAPAPGIPPAVVGGAVVVGVGGILFLAARKIFFKG